MYKEFYLMRKEPFDSHPSPELFYKSMMHQTAWHYLVQGIKQHEPILVLAGDYGAGKTLLFLKLVRLLGKKSRLPIVSVPSPTYTFAAVLEKIVEKLLNISEVNIDAVDESTLQQAVYEYFEKVENKSPIYVVIDDAQEFSYSFINKLRLFASYNCDGFFPIRLIFFAHHSFLKMLNYKKLVALGQRIKRIYHLKPLNFEETKEYIYYRLIHSGATGTPIFDDDAIAIIQDVSGGNPRLINNVCDNCLLLAGEERVNLIDRRIVYLAMDKGSLTGLKEVERLPHDPVVKTEPEPPSFQSGFRTMRESADAAGYPPQDAYSQYIPQDPPVHQQAFQPQPGQPSPVPPPPMPGAYSNPVPHHIQPNPANQMYSNGYQAPPAGSVDDGGVKRKTFGFLEQYGKIILIVILSLIIVFLSTYLYNQYNADKMLGMRAIPEKRITKQVPAYSTIDEVPIVRQLGKAGNVKIGQGALSEKHEQKINAYKPILLTGNLES